MTPRRYQLRKEAVGVVLRGHPWIFREQLSSAADVFDDGDWLRLVDGKNQVLGYGMFEREGAVAIRILRQGAAAPDTAWLNSQLDAALARRGLGPAPTSSAPSARSADPAAPPTPPVAPLTRRTNGLRLLHGESDGLPAVVVDRFGDTLVAQSYARGADALARWAACTLARRLAIPHVLLRPAHRRAGGGADVARVVRGTPPDVAHFTEDGVKFAVDLAAGQKSGAFLDLRGLRRAVAATPLTGARVLNLFCYSGMLGAIAERAGAATIVQVDASERALAFARQHHVADPARHELITADVFEWLQTHEPELKYDLVIVDPPSMTSHMAQVPRALAAYRKLYRAAAKLVALDGMLVAACCTSRIERAVFHEHVAAALGSEYTLERELAVEPDHPVGFPQADYLKVALWGRTG